MVVLVAKAAVAVPEALADHVAGGVLAPPLRVAAGHHLRRGPAQGLRLAVEEPRPLPPSLPLLVMIPAAATRRWDHPVCPLDRPLTPKSKPRFIIIIIVGVWG